MKFIDQQHEIAEAAGIIRAELFGQKRLSRTGSTIQLEIHAYGSGDDLKLLSVVNGWRDRGVEDFSVTSHYELQRSFK